MPQLRNVLDCLVSTELKFQGELLTEHGATEQHERPQKSPRLGLGRLRRLRPSGPSGPSARSPRAAGPAGSAGAPVGPRPRRPCRLPPPGCSCLLIARSSTSREASTRAGLSVCLGLGSGSGLGLGLGLGLYLEGGFYTSGPLTLTRTRTRTSRRLECGPARVAASARRGAARAASHGGGHLRDAPSAPRSAPP